MQLLSLPHPDYPCLLFFLSFILFLLCPSLSPSRSAGADSHHYVGISLRQILSGWLLLAQCPEWRYLGLRWACHFHHHGQKIKSLFNVSCYLFGIKWLQYKIQGAISHFVHNSLTAIIKYKCFYVNMYTQQKYQYNNISH